MDSLSPLLPADVDLALTTIAKKELGFSTLETRRSDSLDFRSCAAWTVKEALRQAYELGRQAGADAVPD